VSVKSQKGSDKRKQPRYDKFETEYSSR
jgi:hypothetical protein